MKKAGAILILYIIFFLTACNGGGNPGESKIQEESNAVNAVSSVKGTEWVYVPEIIDVRDKRADYGDMQLIGDTLCYITMIGEEVDGLQTVCHYSVSEKERKTISIDWQPEGAFWEKSAYTFDRNLNMWLIANVYSVDYSQLRRFLCKFDPEGKNLFSKEITEELGRGISIGGMICDSQGQIYVYADEYTTDQAGVWLYDKDGEFHGYLDFDSSQEVQVKGTVEGEDGKLYLCISKGESPEYCSLMELDYESIRLTELIEDFPNCNGLCTGKQQTGDLGGAMQDSDEAMQSLDAQDDEAAKQYDFLLYDNIFAYGYDLATKKKEELFTWADSDVNGYYVTNLGISEDDRYFCMVEDWTNDDRCVVFLQRTRWEEAPKRINLTLATVDGEGQMEAMAVQYNRGSQLAAMAVRYNRSNSQYHLTVKNYNSLTDFYNAVLAKESIDIVDLSGVNVEKLTKQGFFENLTPYLEQSEKFKPSDFLDGLLEAYTFDGTLVGIPEAFVLRTLVGDRTYIGNDAGLALDGFLEAVKHNPDALPLDGPYKSGITREEVMQYIMIFNEDVFIDWDTGECHFDSETFQAILEMCRCFPDSNTGDRQSSDESEASLPTKLQNGEVLFTIADMDSLKDFQLYEAIFGETAACIGFPTGDGKGGTLLYAENAFGIAASSGNKGAAWKFVESIPDWSIEEGMEKYEIYRLFRLPDRLPALKSTLNIMKECITREDQERVANGGRAGGRIYPDGWSFDYHTVTEDEIKVILDLLKNATPAFDLENNEIIKIINEETPGYYSGQKSVEDVVSVIQNRAQLYVNENK